jgi:anaerobic ribonucleoside-triphosphate reductase
MAFDLAAKFGTPYFDNQIPAYRGAGKGISCYQCCLTGDTEVIAKRNGTVRTMPIEDLMPDDLLFTPTGFQPFASLLIQTIDGDTYEEDLVEITTDMGKVIRCTEDHMIPVHRGDSMDLTFVRADTVGIGDALCINNTLYYTDSLDNLEELCDDLGEELIAAIKSVPYTGKVYDPINVEGRTFWLRNGILSSNCAYNFSSNIDEDDEFFDKVYFRNGAHFSMGSLQVVTLNCPRAAYDAGNDVEKLIRNLKNYMNVARDVFVIKKRWIDEIIKCNKLPFVVQRPRDPVTGEPGTMAVDMDGLVCTIGVLGVNEMVQAITGYQLHESKEARKTALYVLAELNKHARTLSEEVGLKIVVARTPAETTCQRFAVSDLLNPEYTEKARAVVHGDIEAFDRMKKTTRDLPVYYTNGTHVAVDAPVSLPERMNIENPFFVLVQGGNIFHVWLGEAHPDPRGLYDFCMNIATRTQIGYFALTRDMTVPVNRYTWYTGA